MNILYAIGALILLALIIDAASRRHLRRLRQSGLYPPAGQGSDGDVERLLLNGRKIAAVKLYREIHRVDLKTAKEAVETLARMLPPAALK